MIKYLMEKRLIIAAGMILFMLFGLSIKVIRELHYVSMKVSLNYPGVEKGINPDGTRFDIFEVVSDKVLDKTLSKLGGTDMTLDYLRSRINVYAIVPTNINGKVKAELVAGKDFSYFPNEFFVTYSQKNKFAPNYTMQLLQALADSYKEVFKEKYTDRGAVLIDTEFNKNDFEYLEMGDIFNNKILTIINYLSVKNNENGSFRSTVTNQTFENLIIDLKNLRDVDVYNFNAYVNVSAIAKNKIQLIEKLTYEISDMELDYKKYKNEENISKEAMSMYDS